MGLDGRGGNNVSENPELYVELNRWEAREDVYIDDLLTYEVVEKLYATNNEILASELEDWAAESEIHPDDFRDLPGEDLLQTLLGSKKLEEVL